MIHLLIFMMSCFCVLGQSLDDVIVPQKTDIFITLQRSISTATAQPGDKFYGRIAVPVTVEDRIVIPVGSYVIGHVLSSQEPGYLKGKGELLLGFDSIILPNGTTRQVEAMVQSSEGYRTDQKEERGQLEGRARQGKDTAAGAAGGAVAGAAIGGIAGRDLKGVGVGAAIGAGGGALLGLFRKGDDVVLRKGTSITIQLQTDIRLVKPTPRKRGIRLNP